MVPLHGSRGSDKGEVPFNIDIAFRCEEPGMAIYEKNNNVFFGIDFKDMDEAMILVRENNDKDGGRVWVNKYQLVG